jgi:hypothetical protein
MPFLPLDDDILVDDPGVPATGARLNHPVRRKKNARAEMGGNLSHHPRDLVVYKTSTDRFFQGLTIATWDGKHWSLTPDVYDCLPRPDVPPPPRASDRAGCAPARSFSAYCRTERNT